MDSRRVALIAGSSAVLAAVFICISWRFAGEDNGMACDPTARPSFAIPDDLMIEPQDGVQPVLDAIRSASHSIDLAMYELGDFNVEAALVSAEERGVRVRAMLDPGDPGSYSSKNKEDFDFLRSSGVPVRWSPASFTFMHEKALVIDKRAAFILSFNLVPKYYPTSRDFGIVDHDACDVAAIDSVFDADWQGNQIVPRAGNGLVWSPGARPSLAALMDQASTSLDVYNEEMSDPGAIAALQDASRRGVRVRVVMTGDSEWKTAFNELASAGVKVRTFDPEASLYIHAKAMVIDGKQAFVGSENFSKTSLEDNRELGIIVNNPVIAQSIEHTFEEDWGRAAQSGG